MDQKGFETILFYRVLGVKPQARPFDVNNITAIFTGTDTEQREKIATFIKNRESLFAREGKEVEWFQIAASCNPNGEGALQAKPLSQKNK